MIIEFRKLHKILKMILLIGTINLYNIVKQGIIFRFPTSSHETFSRDTGIIIIQESNIRIIILIIAIMYLIFEISKYVPNNSNGDTTDKRTTVEYELLIGLGLIGLITLLLSNDFVLLYLGLELYSYTIYILLLIKETVNTRRVSIIYLIISSLTSGFILISIALIYKGTGTMNIEDSIEIYKTNKQALIPVYIILVSLLFKLGAGPSIYWVIRVYKNLDRAILLYQLLIPKFVFFILLLKFITYICQTNEFDLDHIGYLIYWIGIISLSIGAIGGIFQHRINLLMSYSSVLNLGFLLLSLSFIIFKSGDLVDYNYFWPITNFFFIYFLNLLGFFSASFLFYRSFEINKTSVFYYHPFFLMCYIILILSFIGFPPLGGFFGKFYLFILFFGGNEVGILSILGISIFILSTIISSFFYFKLIGPSTSLSPSLTWESLNGDKDSKIKSLLYTVEPSFNSYLLAFICIILIIYPFICNYLIPYFELVL